jgi:hypothetical protein
MGDGLRSHRPVCRPSAVNAAGPLQVDYDDRQLATLKIRRALAATGGRGTAYWGDRQRVVVRQVIEFFFWIWSSANEISALNR